MSESSTIVVATDFSETSQHATDEALALARQLGRSVTLVHAYELPLYAYPDGAWLTSSEMATSLSASCQRLLDEEVLRCRARGEGVEVTGALRMGAPWVEVTELARATGARLIVVGTAGRRGLPRMLMGSTAERILRSADRPVLAVHVPADAGAGSAPASAGSLR